MPDDPRARPPHGEAEVTADASSEDASRRASHRWFQVAVLATIIAIAVLVVLFAGLVPDADSASRPDAETVSPPASGESLVVAVARTPGGPTEWSNWARVIKHMSEELGLPVSVRYLSKEDEAADVIAEEDIDVAFVCAHQYVELRERGSVTGLCSPVIDGDHMTTTMLVVSADDEAESFEDLQGSVIGASDKSSLGGFAYLSNLCAERGVNPYEHFAEVRLGDTQERNMRALLDGEIRATVVNSAQVVAWDMSGFKVVESSRGFGTPPVVVDSDLDPELESRIRAFLLSFDDELLPSESYISGFVKLDEGDYAYAEVLREACGQHDHP
jgi:ABC-type phosphate/phosphonate transport system substrate-binding protein